MKRIAVVGLGQIGGSIVLTLRKQNRPYSIAGIDPSSKRLNLLKPLLDETNKHWNPATDADLTIVCLHYGLTVDFLEKAGGNRLMMDVCSGKSKIVRLANRKKLRFIGGHPMAGNEFAREKGWRDNLFENAPFFLCRSKRSSIQDLRFVQKFVKDLGAFPVIVDPGKHDRFVSITSHFPAFLAGILNEMGKNAPSQFHGPGYQSMIRLAKTDPELLKTFLDSNGDNILRSAKQMRAILNQWIEEITQRHRVTEKRKKF